MYLLNETAVTMGDNMADYTMSDEEKRKARQFNDDNLSSSIGRGARQVTDAISEGAAFTRDKRPPVNIYAEGSPTERIQSRMGIPGAGLVGTAVDTATLIPRSFGRVADNMYRGFTGQPANDSEFVMNPATRALTRETPETRSLVRAAAASPMSPANLDRAVSDAPRDFAREQREKLDWASRIAGPAPTGATRTIEKNKDTGDFFANDTYSNPGPGGFSNVKTLIRDPRQNQKAFIPADQQTSALASRAEKAASPESRSPMAGVEVINGKVSTRFGDNGSTTTRMLNPGFLPTPRELSTNVKAFSRVTGYDKNENPIYSSGADEMRAVNEGITSQNMANLDKFNAENAQYASINGELPYKQAQTADIPKASERADKTQASADRKNKLADEYLDPNTPDERRNRIGKMLGVEHDDSFSTVDRYENGDKVGQSIYSQKSGKILGGPDASPEMQIISSNPLYKKTFDEAPPEQKSEILKKIRERLMAGK